VEAAFRTGNPLDYHTSILVNYDAHVTNLVSWFMSDARF